MKDASALTIFILQSKYFWDQYSRVANRRRGRNKRGGYQISAKMINGEGAINGETGKNKNTAIRNFIDIKSSNNLAKISTKRTKEIQR